MLDEAASSAGSRADDQVQGQQAALLSKVRISRRRQGVRGNTFPDRQSIEVDRANYEVGRRNFVAWSIWTILHLPFTGASKRPAAAVQVGDAIDCISRKRSLKSSQPTTAIGRSGRSTRSDISPRAMPEQRILTCRGAATINDGGFTRCSPCSVTRCRSGRAALRQCKPTPSGPQSGSVLRTLGSERLGRFYSVLLWGSTRRPRSSSFPEARTGQ